MKFKVFDSRLKSFLSQEFYCLDSKGKLHYQHNTTECSEWIKPIFTTGKTDKNGAELFNGDIFNLLDSDGNIISPNNVIDHDDFIGGDYWIKNNGDIPIYEKIGSKYENPELMNSK